MLQKLDEPVSVKLIFDHSRQRVVPTALYWQGRQYPVIKIGLHHMYRAGRTLYHVFSVETESLFFRLVLDTDTLFWRLEEISDGEPS